MRARRVRASLCAAVLMTAPLASCTKNAKTNVKVAGGEGDAPGERARSPESAGQEVERGPVEKIGISASVTGIGDMLDAGSKLLNMWSPPEPGAPPIDLRNLVAVGLIQQGFGPGFLESIELDGVHAAQIGFPHEGQPGVSEADVDLALSIAAIDPGRAIESMPAGMQPQPVGEGVWQLAEDNMELYFRAQKSALEVALSMAGLDLAHGLPGQVQVGPDEPRVRVAATNLPPVDIDVSELIPLPQEMARALGSIINELESVELAADFGTTRDLTVRVGAEAPFGRLGLDPIGPASQRPSALARAMPPEAMFAWVMPWGDPKLLHQVLDKRVPVDQIPAPFDSYADQVLAGAHGVLDVIESEVLAAAYVEKGQVSLVLAGQVDDEAAARDAMREVFGAAEKAFSDHIALVGNSPDHKYKVSFKKSAVRAGKAKADLFVLTIPKDKRDDLRDLGWMFGDKKPQLEVATLVADGKLVIAIGVGQKSTMSEIGRRLGKSKSPDEGLESGGGLSLARKLANGCQYCISVDPLEIGEMVFTALRADQSEPAEVQKAAGDALKKLAKLDLDGEVAFAVRLEDERGALGFGVPKSLLFAEPDEIRAIVEMMSSIEEARQQAWSTQVPSGAPGGAAPRN